MSLEVKDHPKLTPEQERMVKNVFELYADEGKIYPDELIDSMKKFGYDKKNPIVFEIFEELNDQINNQTGLTLEELMNQLNDKLTKANNKVYIDRVFRLFKNNNDVIDLDTLKKLNEKLEDNLTEEQLKKLLERASEDGKAMNADDFYFLLSKQIIEVKEED